MSDNKRGSLDKYDTEWMQTVLSVLLLVTILLIFPRQESSREAKARGGSDRGVVR